ncbi:release factor glutamine methyltransferase [Rhodopseudomonas thermotolerans]|uniref:Release factor glutamine methyltransferase n=2 Tax=Rhodopseudomonas TaxID=1073 RepID=A0A336JNY8_9BRAD|nr:MULTISPECIES: peptide chain release factor N(5)-glutamine methyltransferase [Rhodopseudomonas]RED38326.1 release factor glutamine methyltransferase [Rhodopseudomonas pentothenatexigens]REG05911.1 release factor glutamine methyltransferase [Rhodopseudomonas thermotolerans]SSW89779.1 release factor glutamine methyltransferase [Rhodopseudomonas pentothenatexigens]
MSDAPTVASARRRLARQFQDAAIESAALDARLLVGEVTGLDLTGLITQADRVLTHQQIERLQSFAARRLGGEPVARILGMREFWGLPFELSADTLVPRPDTETVVEATLAFLAERGAAAPRILDIGTGSGAILLALLYERPDAVGVATDISLGALRTARCNAQRLGLADRVCFVACDYTAALRGPFDLIVSNPPYIPGTEIAALDREVREHDPRRALDGGADGLDAYRKIIPESVRLLQPDGALTVEIGQGQEADVSALMQAAGLTVSDPFRADLSGIFRSVTGRLAVA